MQPRCFIDLDGVLADFVRAALQVHGRTIADIPPGTYELEKVWGLTGGEFWEPLRGAAFWSNIDQTPEALQIMHVARACFGQDNIAILTAPSQDPECYWGKKLWVRANFPDLEGRLIFATPGTKQFFSSPINTLMDDRDSNIEEWRAAGGQGVLVPRPWNKDHQLDTLKETVIGIYDSFDKSKCVNNANAESVKRKNLLKTLV